MIGFLCQYICRFIQWPTNMRHGPYVCTKHQPTLRVIFWNSPLGWGRFWDPCHNIIQIWIKWERDNSYPSQCCNNQPPFPRRLKLGMNYWLYKTIFLNYRKILSCIMKNFRYVLALNPLKMNHQYLPW